MKSALAFVSLMFIPLAGSANATSLVPGDIVTASEDGDVRVYSALGADLGVFVGGLGSPAWLTADTTGNIWVSEYTGDRIDKFAPDGTKLLSFTTPFQPGDVRVASDGTVYVGDYFTGQVYHFSVTGTPLGLFVSTPLSRADYMTFDSNGNLYVGGITAVEKISPTGADLGTIVTLSGIEGLDIDADGNLYVANGSQYVQKYSPTGISLGSVATIATGNVYGLAFDAGGNLYITSLDIHSVDEYSAAGVHLESIPTLDLPRDVVVVPAATPVPEPATLAMLASGVFLTFVRRRRARSF